MAIKILHKGIQLNLDLNPTGMNGDPEHDAALAYVIGLVAGKAVGLSSSGYAILASGDVDQFFGFLVNDAVGEFYENKPALASRKVAVAIPNCVIETDQIDTATLSAGIAYGATLYISAVNGEEGTVAVATTGNKIGIAMNTIPASSSAGVFIRIAVGVGFAS